MYQTHDMINVYHIYIISYLYLVLYSINSLLYSNHQTYPIFFCVKNISY